MNKTQVKDKIIRWLQDNGVELKGKKMRLINYRGNPELRIYTHTMEYVSDRISFRKTHIEGNEIHGTKGHHTIKQTMYIHVSLKDIENAKKDEEEKKFILAQFI